MVLVNHIDVIMEEARFILFFQTELGNFNQFITSNFAQQLQLILNNQTTLYGSLLSESEMKLNYCHILYQNGNLISNLISVEKKFLGMWQEGLLIALELKSPIFLDENLLINDYQPNDLDHENLVAELISQEEKYTYSCQIKTIVQSMMQAVADERYEDAALFRDQLQQLKEK